MSEARHTPGLMEYSYPMGGDPDFPPDPAALMVGDYVIAYLNDGYFRNEDEMNATGERLSACWNACESLTDPSAVADLLAACLAWNQPAKTAEDIDRAYELTRAAIRKATRVPA